MSEQQPEIRELTGKPGYGASRDGRMWTRWIHGHHRMRDSWRELNPATRAVDGRRRISLKVDGKLKAFFVGRLILEAFVGPCPEGMECCHNDGVASNDNVDNLRWDTRKANHQDAVRHGTHSGLRPKPPERSSGEANGFCKYSTAAVLTMRLLAGKGWKVKLIAILFECPESYAHSIVSGTSRKNG